MKVGIQARLKNGILWEAAKQMGSNRALADHLGVSPAILGLWINFGGAPNFRNTEKILTIEKKLLELTGHTLEEIFPPEIRGKAFLKRQKKIDAIIEMPVEQLMSAGAIPQLPAAPDELLFQKEADATISYLLEQLRPREQRVINLRFGLNGEQEHTLEECAEQLHVTSERIRQIEMKALGRLRHPSRSRPLARMLESESRVLLGEYHIEPHSFPKGDN